MKKCTIGILAHVDSGKTTLSEALLYKAGEIRKLGRVDHKNAFLDTHELEKKRGITIFSKQATLTINNSQFTLLDTPGHIDFSTEMERTLSVLDYAILLINATDGVQSHTSTMWRLLHKYNIPTFIFINKMDLANEDKQCIIKSLQKRLGDNCLDFSEEFQDENSKEAIAVCDETLMEKYLNGKIFSKEDIIAAIRERKLFPILTGSALKLEGIDELISALDEYTAVERNLNEFSARVFKISFDDQGNRLTHIKLFGGTIKVRDSILIAGKSEKINQIRIYSGNKFKAVDNVNAGDVCCVTGLSETFAGQALGVLSEKVEPVLQPVLKYKLWFNTATDPYTAFLKLKTLKDEDPLLDIVWNEIYSEIEVHLMGEVQMEILTTIIKDKYGYDVIFGEESILYKETILDKSLGIGHFEPLGHYSEVQILLTPNPQGKGITIDNACPENMLDKNYQNLILSHIIEKEHIGILTGSPITDINFTLFAGKSHLEHTTGGDFRQATYRAIRQGLAMAKSVLLEPYYEFTLEVPSENIGRALSDLQKMHADFKTDYSSDNTSIITGKVPVVLSNDYHREVLNYTKGLGVFSFSLAGYFPCHNQQAIVKEKAYNFEADMQNTADSVFCANGAGFVVPWNEVDKYKHINLEWKAREQFKQEKIQSKKYYDSPYTGSFEDDKELMAIFERTYGSINKTPDEFFRPTKKTHLSESYSLPRKQIKGPGFLLVDGYNIIFAWDDLKKLADTNIEAARSALVNILSNYQAFIGSEVILVFDAYKVKGHKGEVEKVHNISVVYTKEAETADLYIEKTTKTLAKNNYVRVATSDHLEQLIILGHGALRVSASAFREEVMEANKNISEIISKRK